MLWPLTWVGMQVLWASQRNGQVFLFNEVLCLITPFCQQLATEEAVPLIGPRDMSPANTLHMWTKTFAEQMDEGGGFSCQQLGTVLGPLL